MLEVLTRSPHEVDTRCPHSGSCGGCSFQQLAYPAQLTALRAHVEAAFAAAGLEVAVPEVVGCDPPFGYRNPGTAARASKTGREGVVGALDLPAQLHTMSLFGGLASHLGVLHFH